MSIMRRMYKIFTGFLFATCIFMGGFSDIIAQDRPLGTVIRFKPTVLVQNLDQDKRITLNEEDQPGETLFSGDTLQTNENGYAMVVFMDNSRALLKPRSSMIVRGEISNDVKDMSSRIDLRDGEVFLDIQPQGANDFEVGTSRSLASVKGTKFGSTALGYVWVEQGQVDVTALNSGQTVSLFDRMFAQVDENGNNIETGTLSQQQLNNLNEDNDALDDERVPQTLILRFRDANGQVKEVEVTVFVKKQDGQ